MQRDYFGYFLAVLSIILGAYISWFYYQKSIQQRNPVFAGDYMPSTIYDVKQEMSVPLKVMREDGAPLIKSVHVASNLFWNAGNLPISQNEVLTPIKVTLGESSAELISVALTKQSRSVVGCSVKQNDSKSFTISFKILEENDGCQIRAFYSGPHSPKYKVSGDIVGVKNITTKDETVIEAINKREKDTELLRKILGYTPRTLLWWALAIFAFLHLKKAGFSRQSLYFVGGAALFLVSSVLAADHALSRLRFFDGDPYINTADWVSSQAASQ